MALQHGIISIGVTGHRFLTELDRVTAGVDRALAHIQTALPSQQYHILSALAEGADRLVAVRAMETLSAGLVAVLPFERAEYEKDFPESKPEFDALLARAAEVVELKGTGDRPVDYDECGKWIVDRSDVMIAVWDGLPPQGRGGVGDIIAKVRSDHKPLVIVSAGNRVPGTNQATSLGARQGEVMVEGL